MKRALTALLLITTPAGAAEGVDLSSTPLRVHVIDGDPLSIGSERIRLRSEAGAIDATELRSAKCPLELFRAEAARDRLRAIMAPAIAAGDDFSIDRRGYDRYGRTVAVIHSQGVDVGARLVREGYAKMWRTLRKKDRPTWCGF